MKKVDKPFLIASLVLIIGGFLIFSSASLSLLAKSETQFSSVLFNQTFFGLFLGSIACLMVSRIHYRFWRKKAFYIFLGGLALTSLLFIPGLGLEHGGATRWISIGNFTFQPTEFLKIGFIVYLAAWLSGVKSKVGKLRYGIIPFLVILGVTGLFLLTQPDTDTLVFLFVAGLAMLFTVKAKLSHIAALVIAAGVGFVFWAQKKGYVMDRILTFWDPSVDVLGSGWQIQQSLITIGSGGVFGRGFGQSVQKFGFLPEPIGDSIFAIIGEEFGFVGSVILILTFLFFAYRGLKIAARAPDVFGGLLVVGIIILIIFQSFSHIAGLLGVFPLSGSPLLFVSHGGTALFATLIMVGMVLNVSRYQKK